MKQCLILVIFFINQVIINGQDFSDKTDNWLIGHYFFFQKDFESAVFYYSKSNTNNSYDASLEIEALIRVEKSDEATSRLNNYARNGLDSVLIFNNQIIEGYIEENRLKNGLLAVYKKYCQSPGAEEIYHLLETDQLLRKGVVDEKTWAFLDTVYILPRLVNYLSHMVNRDTFKKDEYYGLSTLLMHQVRYNNGYEKLQLYIEKFHKFNVLNTREYASIMDQYYYYNNEGVQKYGTIILPQGRYGYIEVFDKKNIDNIRAEIGLPPLLYDFNFRRLGLELPKWYIKQLENQK